MSRRRQPLHVLMLAALLATSVAGCGDDKPTTAAPGATTTAGTGATDTAWCDALGDGSGPLDPATPDKVPAEYRDAVVALVGYSALFVDMDTDSAKGPTPETTKHGADALSGKADALESLSKAIATTCGDAKKAQGVHGASTVAALSTPDAVPAYCDALRGAFDTMPGSAAASAGTPSRLDKLADPAVVAAAPASHRDAITVIASMSGPAKQPSADDLRTFTGTLMGLGLYADAKCGVAGAFAAMAFVGAFANIGGDATRNAGSIGAEPAAADPAPATALLPAGSTISFETTTIAMDKEGQRKVSIATPKGWETDQFIGVKIQPPSGSGLSIFSEISLDAGCDGVCEVTDWDARVRGDNGTLASFAKNRTVGPERTPAGSEGVVVTATSSDGDVSGLVLRWDDTVDHYLRCQVQLDDDDASLLNALMAACEAARPNWFSVK